LWKNSAENKEYFLLLSQNSCRRNWH
jgi:hypothetical protein